MTIVLAGLVLTRLLATSVAAERIADDERVTYVDADRAVTATHAAASATEPNT